MGPTGSGKSFVAEAIGYRVCMMCSGMENQICLTLLGYSHSKDTGQYLKFPAILSKILIIIIDDFLMNAN